MKAPICEICLNSDILCKVCQEKLDKRIINQSDIDISRAVYGLSKSLNILKDIEVKKVLETDNMAVIICKKGDASKLIGKDGVVARRLSKNIGKGIRVIEESNDLKEFIQNLIYPVPLLRINIVYLPDEKEVFKIVIPKEHKLQIDKATLSDLTYQMFGKESVVSKE